MSLLIAGLAWIAQRAGLLELHTPVACLSLLASRFWVQVRNFQAMLQTRLTSSPMPLQNVPSLEALATKDTLKGAFTAMREDVTFEMLGAAKACPAMRALKRERASYQSCVGREVSRVRRVGWCKSGFPAQKIVSAQVNGASGKPHDCH